MAMLVCRRVGYESIDLHCVSLCHILSLSYLAAHQETPHTFIVKFRRKGPLSIDKTDIHNAHTSEPLQNMRVVWLRKAVKYCDGVFFTR